MDEFSEKSLRDQERNAIPYDSYTDREMKQYFDFFGVSINELKGRVLELGSGLTEKAVRGMKKERPDLEIVVCNPQLAQKNMRDLRIFNTIRGIEKNKDLYQQKISVLAALASDLPFPDNSFNTIISNYAIPFYLPEDKNLFKQVFSEIKRVLAENGIAYFYPITNPSAFSPFAKESAQKRLDMLTSILSELRLDFRFKLSPKTVLEDTDWRDYVLIIRKKTE